MMETVEKLWVVEGSTGEYSDRYEWRVCAFRDEARADGLATELNTLAKACFVATKSNRSNWQESDEGKLWLAKDPKASLDYTGSDYTTYKLELRP